MADGVVRIVVEYDGSQVREGVKQTDAELGKVEKKGKDVAESLTKVGLGLTAALTAPIVLLGKASVTAATEIDTSLTSVRKTVDGTAEQYEALKDAAVEFSKTNAVSAADMLTIQSLGAQLGFTIDELKEFAEVASGLDIATNMSADTASTQMAQFANITGMSHDVVRRYASTIVELGNNMATTEADISNMAQRIAAAGTQVGLSQAEILGMSAALTSMGISAEAGGTAISTIMSNIDKEVAKGSKKADIWAEAWLKAEGNVGKSAEDFKRAWQTDVVGTLSDVLTGMDAAVDEGGNMALMLEELGIGGIRQTDVLKRLTNNSGFLAKAVGLANKAWEENIALDKEVANRNDSIAAKFQMVKNRATAVLQELGGPLADAILSLIDLSKPFIDTLESMAKWFSDLDEENQKLVIGFAGFLAGIGPLTAGLGKVIKAFTTMKTVTTAAGTAVTKLTLNTGKLAAAGALGAVIAALAILVPLIIDLKNATEVADKATSGFSSSIKSADGIRAALDEASAGAEDYVKHLGEVSDRTQEVMKEQAKLFDTITGSWNDMQTDYVIVERYIDTISELTAKTSLTKEEQIKLKQAVEGYNKITGDSILVLDAAKGKISEETEVLQANSEAWHDNARAQAAQAALIEVYRQKIETEQQLAAVEEELSKYSGDEKGVVFDLFGQRIAIGSEEWQAYQQLILDREKLTAATEELAKAEEFYTGVLGESTKAAEDNSESLADLIRSHANYLPVLKSCGMEVNDFIEWLKELGLTEDGIAALTDEDLDAIAKAYEDTSGEVGTTLDGLIATANEKGAAAGQAFADGIDSATGETTKLGASLVQGFANGIAANAGAAYSAAWSMTKNAMKGIADAQRSASPSKEAMKLGGYLGEGYTEGIASTEGEAIAAAKGLAESVLSAVQIDSAVSGLDWYASPSVTPQMLFGQSATGASPAYQTTPQQTQTGEATGDTVQYFGDMHFNVSADSPEDFIEQVFELMKQARYNYGRR